MPKEAKAKESGFKTDHIKDMRMTDDGIEFVIDDDLIGDDDDLIEVEGEEVEDGDEEVVDDDEIVEDDDDVEERVEAKGKSKGKAALAGDSVDAKIAAMEARIDAKFDLLLKAIGGKKEEEEVEDEEDDDVSSEDLADPLKLLGVIEKRVGKTLDKRLQATEKKVEAASVRAQFDDAYARHGEPFRRVSRTVADIMAKTLKPDGTIGMTIDEAFEFVKKHNLGGVPDTQTTTKKKKLTKSKVLRETERRRVDADDEDEVVNTETRTPLRVKGRSIKDTAYEALRLLSRGEQI